MIGFTVPLKLIGFVMMLLLAIGFVNCEFGICALLVEVPLPPTVTFCCHNTSLEPTGLVIFQSVGGKEAASNPSTNGSEAGTITLM